MTNLNLLKIIVENIKSREPILTRSVDLSTIYYFLKKLETEKNKFNYAYLNYYLYNNISKNAVAKRKTTSREFEDALAIIFDGIVTDEEKRDNSNEKNFFIENEKITKFAISNKREKADIKFGKDYFVSVKTLTYNNKEINFGSLEKITLFSDFGVEKYLNERKGANEEKIGLGSKPRLSNLLKKIQKNGQYNKFRKRFVGLVKFVFSDDLIILVKNNSKIEVFLIEGSSFVRLLSKNSISPERLTSIVNRWEGNSIRMNREPILKIGKRINLDFDFLESHAVKKIIKAEEKISECFISYVNRYPKNIEYRKRIVSECDSILNLIDSDIDNLV